MEENATLQERIDRYLGDELSQAERSAFDAQLESDADFKAQVQHYALAQQALKAEAREQLRTQVAAAYNNYEGEERQATNTSSGGSLRTLWRVAAAVVLVVGLSVGYWSLQSTSDLYGTYYAPPGATEIRDVADDLTKANTLYKNEDYKRAAELYRALASNETFEFRSTALFYLGVCELENGNTKSAIQQFISVPESSNSYSSAQWYLAMGYLKAENYDKASVVLKDIAASPKHAHKTDADELLEKID